MNETITELQQQKKELRKKISQRFKAEAAYCANIRNAFSNETNCEIFLKKIPNIETYKTAFGYAELSNEFPCYDLLRAFSKLGGERITALPVVVGEYLDFRRIDFSCEPKLAMGKSFGIREPDENCPLLFSSRMQYGGVEDEHSQMRMLEKLSPLLILTPARAFMPDGSRLGRGGGFYDKFFAKLSAFQAKNPRILLSAVGLSFSFQILDFIPTEATDFKVQRIITEK